MKCSKCKQYESGQYSNRCKITGDENFYQEEDCDLVDENGDDNGFYNFMMDQMMNDYNIFEKNK